jgi:light-regulated signal transduction histidine kinase (bacteriophytochrome)
VWADSARQKRPVVHNDYPHLAEKKGYPEGHFPVLRHLSVPVMEDGLVRIIIGVGNKEAPYDDLDVSQLELIANEVQKFVQRRRMVLQLEKAASKLESSNQELQQFAYVVSHDLQEPLRMVSSYLALLERRYKDQLDSDADEFIDFAVDGAKRMSGMIDGLLQYSRVETQGAPFVETDLEAAFAEARSNLNLAMQESGAELDQGPLPTVAADASQMARLFQNLLGNALKFRREEPPRLRVEANQQEEEWVISVSDNGIGIAADETKRIFGMFQRLHTREEYPGTGIGLAVCKRIVERHGGRIWVESTEGEGSTFFFTLPVLQQTPS